MAQPLPAIRDHLQDVQGHLQGIQNHFQGMEDVVGLIANMPALVGLNALQQLINAHHLQIVTIFGEMQGQIGQLQGQVGDMQGQVGDMQDEYLLRSPLG